MAGIIFPGSNSHPSGLNVACEGAGLVAAHRRNVSQYLPILIVELAKKEIDMSEEKAVEVKPSLLNFCRSMVEVNTHRVGSTIPDFGDKIEPEQRRACRAWLTAWINNDPGPYGKAIAYVQACLVLCCAISTFSLVFFIFKVWLKM